jgi:hypothetical protein
MTFEYYDVLLIGALVCGLIGVYAVMRWLGHEYRLQAICDEINSLPTVDPYMEPSARFTTDGYVSPRDLRVQLGALPQQKYDEIEKRRLRLVVGGSSRGL